MKTYDNVNLEVETIIIPDSDGKKLYQIRIEFPGGLVQYMTFDNKSKVEFKKLLK